MKKVINEHGDSAGSGLPPNGPPPASPKTPESECGMTLVTVAHCAQYSRLRLGKGFFLTRQHYSRAITGHGATEAMFSDSIEPSAADDTLSHTGQRE